MGYEDDHSEDREDFDDSIGQEFDGELFPRNDDNQQDPVFEVPNTQDAVAAEYYADSSPNRMTSSSSAPRGPSPSPPRQVKSSGQGPPPPPPGRTQFSTALNNFTEAFINSRNSTAKDAVIMAKMETEIGRVENKLDMKLFETESRLTNLIQSSMREIQDTIRQVQKKRKRKEKKHKERDSDESDDEH